MGKSGIGACVRDRKGIVLAITSSPLLDGTSNLVETQALLAGLVLLKTCNFHRVHIEGDSQMVINSCIKWQSYSCHLQYIFKKIWHLIDQFSKVTISHTLREGNKVANFISNLGCDGLIVNTHQPNSFIEQFEQLHSLITSESCLSCS